MSVMRITEDQLAAVFVRRPFVQVQDVEAGNAVLTKSNNPIALYIMHISKLSSCTLPRTKQRHLQTGHRISRPSLHSRPGWYWAMIAQGELPAFFVSDPNLCSGLIKHRD